MISPDSFFDDLRYRPESYDADDVESQWDENLYGYEIPEEEFPCADAQAHFNQVVWLTPLIALGVVLFFRLSSALFLSETLIIFLAIAALAAFYFLFLQGISALRAAAVSLVYILPSTVALVFNWPDTPAQSVHTLLPLGAILLALVSNEVFESFVVWKVRPARDIGALHKIQRLWWEFQWKHFANPNWTDLHLRDFIRANYPIREHWPQIDGYIEESDDTSWILIRYGQCFRRAAMWFLTALCLTPILYRASLLVLPAPPVGPAWATLLVAALWLTLGVLSPTYIYRLPIEDVFRSYSYAYHRWLTDAGGSFDTPMKYIPRLGGFFSRSAYASLALGIIAGALVLSGSYFPYAPQLPDMWFEWYLQGEEADGVFEILAFNEYQELLARKPERWLYENFFGMWHVIYAPSESLPYWLTLTFSLFSVVLVPVSAAFAVTFGLHGPLIHIFDAHVRYLPRQDEGQADA